VIGDDDDDCTYRLRSQPANANGITVNGRGTIIGEEVLRFI